MAVMTGLSEMRVNVIPVLVMLVLLLAGCSKAPAVADRFGIYLVDIDGSNFQAVLNSSEQEMTHARISPDGQWITFTRYTERNKYGLAMESRTYHGTEILRVNIDGSGQEILVPAKDGIINANSSWTPDGKAIIYISTDNQNRLPAIYRLDLASTQRQRIPTPGKLAVSDPHMYGEQLVFPARTGEPKGLWLMNSDGTGLQKITTPDISRDVLRKRFVLGDFDPRFSPDGNQVAFMRYFGDENWHLVVKNLLTGTEQDLSASVTTDGLPDWSPDGRWIIFWHANRDNLKETGLYRVRPDGSERQMLPLPRGYLYKHSCFTPDGQRILAVALKDPRIQ
jgi:Tol biopolymer transport system component